MLGTHVRRQLPFAVLATAIVVVAPALVVAVLPGSPGPLIGIPICIALTLGFARAAAALWRRSPRSREVLFADLMLWGWARRLATERRLASVESLVAGDAIGDADKRVRALERVSAMLESRDAYTRRHSLRVTRYSEAIARELDLPDHEVARIRTAAALHDVGKFFTPREILNKPGRLTDGEFAVIKRHPGQGADLLRGVIEPEVEAMIRHHHERLGGAGYPDALVGDAIPLGARIIAVADTFDAMTSTRAYRSARPHTKALGVLREEAGVALDARAVAAFEAYYSGRRATNWSSVASGMTQTLAPLRELIVPAARALPALGASAAITAPMLIGGPAVAETAQRDGAPRAARVAAAAATPDAVTRLARRLAELNSRGSDRPPGTRGRSRREGAGGTGTGPSPAQSDPSRPGGRPRPPMTPVPVLTPAATAEPGPADNPSNPGNPTTTPSEPAAAPTTPSATPAPTTAPHVSTEEVVVGDVSIPGIEVDAPDLPVEVPGVNLPSVSLPRR